MTSTRSGESDLRVEIFLLFFSPLQPHTHIPFTLFSLTLCKKEGERLFFEEIFLHDSTVDTAAACSVVFVTTAKTALGFHHENEAKGREREKKIVKPANGEHF